MLSRAVDRRLKLLAEAIWLRSEIVEKKEKREWLYEKEVMREVRKFFKHSKTRRSYFQHLLAFEFLTRETRKVDREERVVYVPVEPSKIKTRVVDEYLNSLRKQLEEISD